MTGSATQVMAENFWLAQAAGSTTTEQIAVPSGQSVTLIDVIRNEPGPEGLTIRFRFLTPQIAKSGGDVDFDTASGDMLHLCQTYALPRVVSGTPLPSQIIISLSERAIPFGEADPDTTQFFEAFSIDGEACIWEPF